jgi:NTP pyrophosphatase (non-canonical NTP hydrolase)
MDEIKSIQMLQNYIFSKDREGTSHEYFLKLCEEVGELSVAIRKNLIWDGTENIKNTIAEELCDVLYYVTALANFYDYDLETAFNLKDKLNRRKYMHDK